MKLLKSEGLRGVPRGAGWLVGLALFCSCATAPPAGVVAGASSQHGPSGFPMLRIETGVHTSQITQLEVSRNGQRIVSISHDKTLRLWRGVSGGLERIVRVPTNPGYEGQLYGLALSPDGQIAAVTGWTGWDWNRSATIYLVDLDSGEIVDLIQGLPTMSSNLTYSPDGERLVVALARGEGIRIFETRGYTQVAADADYGDAAIGITFGPDGRMATSSVDGFIRLYDRDMKLVQKQRPGTGQQPMAVRFSPDGHRLAVGFLDVPKLALLSPDDLSVQHVPTMKGARQQKNLPRVAWSSDGKTLYGYGIYLGKGKSPVHTWSKAGRGARSEVRPASRFVTALETLPGGGFVFATDDPGVGAFDARNKLSFYSTMPVADFRAAGQAFRLSPKGDVVEFPFEKGGQRLARFSLSDQSLVVGGSQTKAEVSPRSRAGRVSVTDFAEKQRPLLNGRPIPLEPHEISKCASVTADGAHFALGTGWGLAWYDASGRRLWRAQTESAVLAVNIAPEGGLIVAGLGDGTIRWYRRSTGEEALALFPHSNGEDWVVWTPDGYYSASPYGDQFIGWLLNRGAARSADFYKAVQFESVLYRPDIVRTAFDAAADGGSAPHTGDKTRFDIRDLASIAPARIDIVSHSAHQQGVQLEISASKNSLPMTDYAVFVDNIPVTPTEERRLTGSESTAFRRTLTIPLSQPQSRVRIEVNNGTSIGLAETWVDGPFRKRLEQGDLYLLAIGVNRFENLHESMHLYFASQDAVGMGESLSRAQGRAFRRVHSRILADSTDRQPTRENILEALSFLEDARGDDTVVLYLASHGISDAAGNYYFVPKDASNTDINAVLSEHKGRGLSIVADEGGGARSQSLVGWESFFDAMRSVAGRRLLIVDTCQAQRIEGNLDLKSLAKRSAASSFALLAASKGDEQSQEYREGKHGLFTYAFLNGLEGGADRNRDRTISLTEAFEFSKSFVTENRNRAAGTQTPQLLVPEELEDLTLERLGAR